MALLSCILEEGRGKIMMVDLIGEAAMLELLAEECMELAHAALKLARVERGENPTPKQPEECREKVTEEWADVVICLEELQDFAWIDLCLFDKYYGYKRNRFSERIAKKTDARVTPPIADPITPDRIVRGKVWRYVEISSVTEAEPGERICASYKNPARNFAAQADDERWPEAEQDAKAGACRLLVWRYTAEETGGKAL